MMRGNFGRIFRDFPRMFFGNPQKDPRNSHRLLESSDALGAQRSPKQICSGSCRFLHIAPFIRQNNTAYRREPRIFAGSRRKLQEFRRFRFVALFLVCFYLPLLEVRQPNPQKKNSQIITQTVCTNRLFLPVSPLFERERTRTTLSTAENSITSSERPSPKPLLKKEASPAVLGGERILEMLWRRQF